MKPTKSFIEQTYHEMRNKVFSDDALPKEIIVEMTDVKSYLGLYRGLKRPAKGGGQEIYAHLFRFNTRYDLPTDTLVDIILHEMIHCCIAVHGLKDSSSHGPVFKKMMDTINERFGRHITVSFPIPDDVAKASSDTRRRWHVVAVADTTDGRRGFRVLPRVVETIIEFNYALARSSQVSKLRFFLTDDPFFNDYPSRAAYKLFLLPDGEDVMQYLEQAKRVWVDGKKVTVEQ